MPNVLAGVEEVDLDHGDGYPIDLPLFLSPTALQRLFHHEGERAVGQAAESFNTLFGISSLATVGIEEIAEQIRTPKIFSSITTKTRR